MAERRIAELSRALEYAATLVAPEALDDWLKRTNRPTASMSAEEWRGFFEKHVAELKKRSARGGWGLSNDGSGKLKARVQELEEETERLRKLVEQLQAEKERLEAEYKASRQKAQVIRAAAKESACAFYNPTHVGTPMPSFPPGFPPRKPPARFGIETRWWKRAAIVVATIAMTGWSMRRGIAEVLAGVERISPRSGSMRRVFNSMERYELIWSRIVHLAGHPIAVIGLTDKGKELVRFLGFEPVESEWEILQREHGGDSQEGHAVAVVAFTHHARRFGFRTEICPPNPAPEVPGFSPDVAISAEGRTWYVEVENGSGDEERRFRKWKNMEKALGYVAVASGSAETLQSMIREVKGAGVQCGAGVDITALSKNEADPFWTTIWGT